ncbi:MAG TPA: tetratricopeptide repeat protein [Acidiferrobacterales bacterium]
MRRALSLALACAAALTACATGGRDDAMRIKSLPRAEVDIDPDARIEGGREKAMAGYRDFLQSAPDDPLRVEALRRLGDMEIESNEEREQRRAETGARAAGSADYRHAIKLYEDLLKAYPRYRGNDRVLYQLARAYEGAGDYERALRALARLTTEYRATPHFDEAHFRRGEILFVTQDYGKAESAYAEVLRQGEGSAFFEKAQYKHGWARFKQGRYEAGLDSFFGVLDRHLRNRDPGTLTGDIPDLSRGEQELLDDTFRVVSLSLSYLHGPETIVALFERHGARRYEFRVYQRLGDLYLKQERIQDAAGSYNAFVRRYPNHPQAPFFQLKVVDAYKQGGFAAQSLEAKKEFVTRYGVKSEFRRVNTEAAYAQILPDLKAQLEELARHYHGSAQKSKQPADYQEAAVWYRTWLESFPRDPQAAQLNFLLAEMLFESRQFFEAAQEYEKTAYHYPAHAKSADAGYAALLAYDEQEKRLASEAQRAWRLAGLTSAVRFVDRFGADPRTPAVLTRSAERYYALGAPEQAGELAQRVLARQPEAEAGLRRTAWTVVAHTQFERGAFDRAEAAYQQALALMPAGDPARAAMTERLAASVYKQGEQSRATGDTRAAVAHFLRVGRVAPGSPVRATAEYDAAAGLIALKDWGAAVTVLEGFRKAYPNHALRSEVSGKLAVAYLESGQLPRAAAEFEAMAAGQTDPNLRREALWQAAELYDKAGSHGSAIAAYQRYAREFPRPLEPALEARSRVAESYKKNGQWRDYQQALTEIVRADQGAGGERTDRTRYLGATAALTLAEPAYDEYRKVKLVEPLKKSLAVKKDKMQAALKAYGSVAEYGVAEVATASTFRIAEIYRDFSRELLASQRPKGLSPEELEQYDVLLEEQAFPFEEKSIEIHEVNAARVTQGIYDRWVKDSFAALGKLKPVRYAKPERGPEVIDAIR